jgi:hypothetical protein
MASIEYYCYPCRSRCQPTPEGRCPRCGDLAGGVTIETEELEPWQRPERVFGPRQAKLEENIRNVTKYPFQAKRLKYDGKLTSTGRKIMRALSEYAESNRISTQEAIALLAHDMISLVLPMLPSVSFVDESYELDETSFEHWAHDLRRLVNREATEQLLGSNGGKETPPPPVTRGEEDILQALELEFIKRRGRLNEDDLRAIEALEATDDINQREAARALGWTEAQFRKRMQRIREKIA